MHNSLNVVNDEGIKKAMKKQYISRRIATSITIAVLLLGACSTSEELDSSPQSTIGYQSSSASSSNSDDKVPEPNSCPDYQDSYTTPYKYCDSGSDVTKIQESLVALGYSVDVDGYYGPGTRSAVKSYQSSKGLTVTGQVNDSTWSSLVGEDSTSYEYSDEEQPIYEAPSRPIITQQRQIIGITCDLRESGLSSSWDGQSYYWIYYNEWSDGTRSVLKMGQGYNPPYDCL
jgi:peptidoglycan hydrolase-like protein with peptidoglycan-binding domain